MDKILLVGAGGHAKACADVIELEGKFSIAGFVERPNQLFNDLIEYQYIGSDNDLEELFKIYNYALVTVGQIKSTSVRKRLYDQLRSIGYLLPIIISPLAYVSKHASIGEGTIVMHNAVVNTVAQIGRNCIINNKSLIEHDSVIGDHCHISTGAIVNGEVKIGNGTFIGSGAVIHNDITIGCNCIISAGTVVRKPVADASVIKQ